MIQNDKIWIDSKVCSRRDYLLNSADKLLTEKRKKMQIEDMVPKSNLTFYLFKSVEFAVTVFFNNTKNEFILLLAF